MTEMAVEIGWLIGAVLTIMAWSYLYKATKFYYFVEFTIVGFAAGHALVLGILNIRKLVLTPISTSGNFSLLIPFLLGLLVFTQFSQKYRWPSYYPLSILMGAATGLAMRGLVGAQIISQIKATIPLIAKPSINNLIIIVIVFLAVIYFTYTFGIESTSVNTVRRWGRTLMFIAFGALFGTTVLTRTEQFVGIMQNFLERREAYYLLIVGIAGVIADYLLVERKTK
jgi:hypothetical protein